MEEMKMVVRSVVDLPMDIKKCNVDVIQGICYVDDAQLKD
ncbi:2-oxoglutarate-dependent dioxygenase DAO-like [Senna tora]|uniref:2-oxoglutarate-dependent dioxygenase DAO-like n=1 Tax=Senna tora TaxID=362788 RepID=A0A834T4Q1_9FABA|nr:2-oxoglutarate-dependent dioxygenase DAO-like [Senna tora]